MRTAKQIKKRRTKAVHSRVAAVHKGIHKRTNAFFRKLRKKRL